MGVALVDTREEFDSLIGLYLPIALGVLAVVFGLVTFAVVRYRRRDDGLPRQREGLPLAEGLCALAIGGIVAVLLAATFKAEDRVDRVDDDPDLTVRVTAFQWGWRFTYPGTGVSIIGDQHDSPTLMVPTKETVRFTLRSRDVIHSFWIPELRFKRDAFPNRDTTFDLVFSDEGESAGRCAEFCGLAHADMTFHVRAMPADGFERWLDEQRAGRAA